MGKGKGQEARRRKGGVASGRAAAGHAKADKGGTMPTRCRHDRRKTTLPRFQPRGLQRTCGSRRPALVVAGGDR